MPHLPEIVHRRRFKVTTALNWLILLNSFIIATYIKSISFVMNVENTEKNVQEHFKVKA